MKVKSRNSSLVARYVVAGILSFSIELGALFFLKKVCGLSNGASTAIAFWIGFLVAFYLQKVLTFKDFEKSKKALSRQLFFYGGLVIFNYLFTIAVVVLAPEDRLVVARTVALVITTLWNFILYKKIIFKKI
jgi:putative flippase GtrA